MNGDVNYIDIETDSDTLHRLAALPSLEYDRVRKDEAKKLHVRPETLDKEVRETRKQNNYSETTDELTEGVEPWPDSVNGEMLADQVKSTLNRFIVLPANADAALTLWILGTYVFNAFRIFPKLLINSPEKRCGKTTTLEILGSLVHRPLISSNASPSVLFRSVDMWHPTLLIDEADTFINANDELRGIINSGHTRATAFVLRSEGDAAKMEPRKFSTWAPMAIAMIKEPPDTIKDRSLVITLRRKMPDESVERVPLDLNEQCRVLRQQCARWAKDHCDLLGNTNPDIPQVGNDRAIDNWLPLLAIADQLKGKWPELGRNTMMALNEGGEDEGTIATTLLRDIREIFNKKGMDRIFSDELVELLTAMEERPWSEWRRGKPLTTNGLARLLRPFKIKSRQLKIAGTNKNGYLITSFTEVFLAYLPATSNSTTLQTNKSKGFSGFQNSTKNSGVEDEKWLKANTDAGSSEVGDENTISRRVQAEI